MNWNTPPKPAEFAESHLIDAILHGDFPIGSHLPAERELAARMGITRPTLREALQRLSREGWIEIRQGKPTRVCDYWNEGSLGVLGVLASRPDKLPADFIPHLLEVRLALAPAYARLAVERQPAGVVDLLHPAADLPAEPAAFAVFDWRLHRQLASLSGNPIFTLILNGFKNVYPALASRYFHAPAAQARSRTWYAGLLHTARAADPQAAEAITREMMATSLQFWKNVETSESK